MDDSLDLFIERSFATALRRGHIQVFYQPVIRSISRKLCSFEALARWIDPERGMISPGQFIPVLENINKIHLLDIYVIREACTGIRHAIDQGEVPIPVSVNLSRLDFGLCDIFGAVLGSVNAYQVPHEFLYIEVTESIMAEQGGDMYDVIERFREAGFQVWMDDFGSGYSSLNVLKDFAFDEIKLDMKFLSSFDLRSQRIMASVIQMAKRLDMHTLAEGVETEEQFNFLRDVGCEKAQGYYFSRPMRYGDVMAHLAEKGIEVELPADRTYYDNIGKQDFLSALPFISMEERNRLTSARQLNSIPLALGEARTDSFSVLFYNAAFEEVARSTGLVSNIFTQEMIGKPRPYTLLPMRLIDLMDSTRSGEVGRMIFISNEEYYEIQAKCIAQTRDTYCVLFRMSNLSKASELDRTSQLDDGIRQLYALYDRITLLDLDTDSIKPLYVATREDVVSGRSGISQLQQEYAERWIFPEDREGYLAFEDISTLEDRLSEERHQAVAKILRTSVGHGQYEWKEYVLLRLRQNAYLELIRSVDAVVQDFEARADEVRLSWSMDGGTSPLDELVWRRLVNSDLLRFFWKDEDRRFLGASRGFLDYYGFPSVDVIRGKNDEDLGWHVQPGHYMTDEWRVIREGITTSNEVGHCIRGGENREILASKTPFYDIDGKICGLVGYFIDKDMLNDADGGGDSKRRDQLTGLLNSRGLDEEARLYRDEYFLRGTDFARLDIAIDNIGSLNSQYGYDVGDRSIAELGKALKQAFGQSAAVGRHSGHQLTILCQVREESDETSLRRRAKEAGERVHQVDEQPLTLYVSVGSCLFSEVEDLDEQGKRSEIRLLADQDEHATPERRVHRASKIFRMYDDLPIAYGVFHVLLDNRNRAYDATMFYVNHCYEERAGKPAIKLLGKSTREMFPELEEEWYETARRAAYGGEIISRLMHYAPTGMDYYMTASQVIRAGYCCFTYQIIEE